MTYKLLPILVLTAAALYVDAKLKLGDIVPICNLDDPDFNTCAKNSTQTLIKLLKTGVRDLHLIPTDPLNVPALDFGHETGPVSLKLNFNSATITGSSQAIVKNVKLDNIKDYRFVTDYIFPRFELAGEYVAKGKILLLPIDGKGFGNITTTNMDVHVEFNCSRLFKKKAEYLMVDTLKLTYKLDKTYLTFSNLFGSNKALGEATNNFLNENSDVIAEEMRPTLEAIFAELVKGLMNNVFTNVPLADALKGIKTAPSSSH